MGWLWGSVGYGGVIVVGRLVWGGWELQWHRWGLLWAGLGVAVGWIGWQWGGWG